jgi:hypothetical protein
MLTQVCRVCGCTDGKACWDDVLGQPCGWADEDTCTVCARIELALSRLRRLERGRAALRGIVEILEHGLLDDQNQACVFVLLRAAWGPHAGTFQALIRDAIEDPAARGGRSMVHGR